MGLEHKEFIYKIIFDNKTEKTLTKEEYEDFRDQIITNSSRWLYFQPSSYNGEITGIPTDSIISITVTINDNVEKTHRRLHKFKGKRPSGV